MTYIWNIYEPADAACPGPDPFDVFVYTQRMADAPHLGDAIYVEGLRKKIIAFALDQGRNEVSVHADEVCYKVCVG